MSEQKAFIKSYTAKQKTEHLSQLQKWAWHTHTELLRFKSQHRYMRFGCTIKSKQTRNV